MALPLIPILIGGGAVLSTIFGAKKGADSISKNNKAKRVNSEASNILTHAQKDLLSARDYAKPVLENLGKKKVFTYQQPLREFVSLYRLLKNVKLKNSEGLDELSKFSVDQWDMGQVSEMSNLALSFTTGALGGTVAGGAVAFGVYGAAGMFATASTGAAISGLSGVAATNATLAFFGGGSLAVGGLGVAGGMAVLGGIVAGPAIAIMGIVMDAKAQKNLDDAYSNLAEAKKTAEELRTASDKVVAIRRRCEAFLDALIKLNELFVPGVAMLATILKEEGTDYSKFSNGTKDKLRAIAATAQAVKAVLDTPILDADGALTNESERVLKCLEAKKLIVASPSSYSTVHSFPQEEID